MLIGLIIFVSLVPSYIIGYFLGMNAERDRWVKQIRREEILRHTSQGSAFWQK